MYIAEKILGLINSGLNPTAIGFHDDGLFYLFENILTKQTEISNKNLTFVHIPLGYIDNITIEKVEQEINQGLKRDEFPGDTVYETLDHNIKTVCLVDDLASIEFPIKAIIACDNIHKKYRGNVKFIFIVEDPLFLVKHRKELPANSIFFEGIIYQEMRKAWSTESLATTISKSLGNDTIDESKLNEALVYSDGHFGITKRKYSDLIFDIDSTERYINLMVENFDTKVISAFKKYINNKELSNDDQEIINAYERVGFLKNNKISIQKIHEIISQEVYFNKLQVEGEKLIGVDLNLLSKIEREIIATLINSTEEIITRNDIGKLIWGKDINEKYSDWAVDQRIARLRRKIIDLGFDIDIITVYGKGYRVERIERGG